MPVNVRKLHVAQTDRREGTNSTTVHPWNWKWQHIFNLMRLCDRIN